MLNRLPEYPPERVRSYLPLREKLGPDCIIYKRASLHYSVEWTLDELFENACGIKQESHWGSDCYCTACTARFTAGWLDGGMVLREFDDGNTLDGWCDGQDPETVLYRDGDTGVCPLCGTTCQVVKTTSLSRGRKFKAQIAQLDRIGDTGVIIYWLAERELTPHGYRDITFKARAALAVSPDGKLRRFSHVKNYMYSEAENDQWTVRTTIRAPECLCINVGGYPALPETVYANGSPDMTGTTMEKSGIDEYFGYYGAPGAYLYIWTKHPNVENLARCRLDLLAKIVYRCCEPLRYGASSPISLDNEHINLIDWNEVKPHKMLGLTKEQFRDIKKLSDITVKELAEFNRYKKRWPKTTLPEFHGYHDMYTAVNWLEMITESGCYSLPRMTNYFIKQRGGDAINETARMWFDYMRMTRAVRGEAGIFEPLQDVEAFPPHLREAHDRANAAFLMMQRRQGEKAELEAKNQFLELYAKYKPLEWNDGEFCIVVPKSQTDLTIEGTVLHHCVGGYGQQHLSGKPIFFVRHYRRPERAFFTLNENLQGKRPHRIQLHGYGNEWARGKRLTIPDKVLDFVEAWEQEVLAPWFEEEKKKSNKKERIKVPA